MDVRPDSGYVEYFFDIFMDVLTVDFDYLKTHMPIIPTIMQIMLAVGWALLLGNLVFQATRSMMTGLGFEGEDPKLLFTRSFVFAFLLFASPQICEIGLSMTAYIIDVLQVTDAVDVELVGAFSFVGLHAAWLLVIIINLIIMFKIIRMMLEIVEQYLVLAFLVICAPLAFGMGGSRSTSDIFTGWVRMFASMCFVIMSNVIFFKLLISLLGNVPMGADIFVWMALVFGVVKLARKVDALITRIGLNPMMTGDGLSGRSVPGMLAYTVVRSMANHVVKSAGNATGRNSTAANGGGGPNSGGGGPNYRGPANAGASAPSGPGAASNASYNSSSSASQQNTATQNASAESTSSGGGGPNWTPAGQPVDVRPSDEEYNSMSGVNTSAANISSTTNAAGTAGAGERKTSVPPGAVRSPSHVQPGTAGKGGIRGMSTNRSNTAANSAVHGGNTSIHSGGSRPGAAGTGAVSSTQRGQWCKRPSRHRRNRRHYRNADCCWRWENAPLRHGRNGGRFRHPHGSRRRHTPPTRHSRNTECLRHNCSRRFHGHLGV